MVLHAPNFFELLSPFTQPMSTVVSIDPRQRRRELSPIAIITSPGPLHESDHHRLRKFGNT